MPASTGDFDLLESKRAWLEQVLEERSPGQLHNQVDPVWAAAVLERVGDLASKGHYPQEIRIRDLGRAVREVLSTAPTEKALSDFLDGWFDPGHYRP